MRKTVIILFTLLGIATTQAEDYPYMMFQTNDGNVLTMASASLTITFSDGNMVVSNGSESKTVALTDLNKMFFASDPASVETTQAEEANEPVEVFTVTGISVGKCENIQQVQATLERGIYVVKGKNKTLKIAVK